MIATVLTAMLLLAGLVATVAIGGGGLLFARSQRRLRAGAPLTDDAAPAGPGRQEQR